MADFNEPTNTSLYSGIWANVRGLIASCAKMDFSGHSNLPSGAVAFDPSTNTFRTWNGSTWADALPATQTWTPSYGAASPMTYTSVTTQLAEYFRFGKWVFFTLRADGTTGGTAASYITFTLPVAPASTEKYRFGASVYDATLSSSIADGHALHSTGSTVIVFNRTNANWGLGSDRRIYVGGFYRTT